MKREISRGFTLIELLVVISIISMLASVVLVSLQSARDKGRVAAAQIFDHNIYDVLGDKIIAEYQFPNSLGTTISDLGPNNLTLTGSGGSVSSTDVPLNSASSFQTLYGQSVLYAKNSASVPAFSDITVSTWVKAAAVPAGYSDTFMNVNPTNYVNQIVFFIVGGSGYFGVNGNGSGLFPTSGSCLSSSKIDDGKWHHVLFSYKGTTGSLYVDGHLVQTCTGGTTALTNINKIDIAVSPYVVGANLSIYHPVIYGSAIQ